MNRIARFFRESRVKSIGNWRLSIILGMGLAGLWLLGVPASTGWPQEVILATTSWTASFVEAASPELRGFKVVTLGRDGSSASARVRTETLGCGVTG
jgi:hypothetical protein